MAIGFNLIPNNLRVPGAYAEISNVKANRGLSGYPTRVLVIGQKLAGAPGQALTPLLITSKDQAAGYFGKGSQLWAMLERFKDANSFVEVHGIALADAGASAAAAGKLSVSGPASAAGTIFLYIGGRLVQIGVASGASASAIASAIVTAITAATELPVSAAVDGTNNYEVNLTAKNAGEAANFIDVRINHHNDQVLPSGVNITITALTGGTANPDIGTVFDAIGDEWFTDIVCPYTDTTNLVELEEQLKNRYGPLKQIEGKAYLARSATHANLVTAGQARNSYLTVCPGVKGMPNPPYEIAAVFGAVAAFNLQNDPARPLQTLELRGLLAPKLRDRFTLEENNILLHNGIATLGYGADGTVLIQRAITGYRVNNAGAADVSYLDVETLATVAYLRYDIRNSVQLRFPRYKLADDGTNFAPGQPVVTPVIIRSFLLSRFKLWEEAGLTENFAQFEQELLVERDPNDANRVNAGIPANVVNQFRVFAALLDFLL